MFAVRIIDFLVDLWISRSNGHRAEHSELLQAMIIMIMGEWSYYTNKSAIILFVSVTAIIFFCLAHVMIVIIIMTLRNIIILKVQKS